LALREDGKIVKEVGKKRTLVSNNIRLKRLESFNGILYGISADNRLFSLNNDTFNTQKWSWSLTSLPQGIIHTSATLNGKYFWIQTAQQGILYNRKFQVIDRADTRGIKRIYGNDKDIYIDIDTNSDTAVLQPNGTRINNVISAIITHDNELRTLRPNQASEFSDIRLINWVPTFIKRFM
jgi:hypothetical protein